MLLNTREYHKPTTVKDALSLLARPGIFTVPLYSSAALIASPLASKVEAVVDLEALGLDKIERKGNAIHLGSTVTLQRLVDELGEIGGGILAQGAKREAPWNMRTKLTVGSTVVFGEWFSPLLTVLLAMDAAVIFNGGSDAVPLNDVLAREDAAPNAPRLITTLVLPNVDAKGKYAYHQVGRTPADAPIVCAVAYVRIENDTMAEVRLALGGVSDHPLRMPQVEAALKGAEPSHSAITEALTPAVPDAVTREDFLGSLEYRREMAVVMARRALTEAAGLP